MDHKENSPEDDRIAPIKNWLEQNSGHFIPTLRGAIWAIPISMVLFFVLWFSVSDQKLANAGQFFAGTVGSLLAALSSLLLVITLFVQIGEYSLTRRELQNSIDAQDELNKITNEQLIVLKQQFERGEEESQINEVTTLLRELKEDSMLLRADNIPGPGRTGVGLVEDLRRQYNTYYLPRFRSGEDQENWQPYLTGAIRFALDVNLQLQRAISLDAQLEQRTLPSLIRKARRQELVLLVQRRYVAHYEHFWYWERETMHIESTNPALKGYRQRMLALLAEIIQILELFQKIDPLMI